MEQAKVQSEFCSGELRILLSGEIDHHSAVGVREVIDRDLSFFRPKTALLDLSGIEFMDSSGLGLILGRYTKLKEWEGRLVLLDPTPEIGKILKLAGVERLIEVRRTGTGAREEKKKRAASPAAEH